MASSKDYLFLMCKHSVFCTYTSNGRGCSLPAVFLQRLPVSSEDCSQRLYTAPWLYSSGTSAMPVIIPEGRMSIKP